MFFYYSIFILILFLYCTNYRRNRFESYYLIFIVFYLLSFLRWKTGTDWDSYVEIFKDSKYDVNYREIGFSALNYYVRTYTNNYTLLLFVEATLLYLCLFKPFKYYAVNVGITLLAFFAINRGYIFFTRQTIAISICLLSSYFVLRGKLYWAIIIWLSSLAFHSSSLLFGLFFIVYKRRWNLSMIILLLLSSLFVSQIFFRFIGSDIIQTLEFFDRAEKYGLRGDVSTEYASNLSHTELILRSSASRAVIIAALLYVRKKYSDDIRFNTILNCLILSFVLFLGLSSVSMVIVRIAMYFECFEMFSYQYIYNYFSKTDKRNIVFVLLLIYLGLRLYTGLSGYYDCYVPFRFV